MSLSTTPDRPRGVRLALEVLLVAAMALFVMAVARNLQPLGLVGLSNDDALYAIYAKALATGQGYIDLTSAAPRPASRYPIGMPGLLALVAQGATSVQAMIQRWEWVPVIASGFYVATVYGYFRRFAGLTVVLAAGLTMALSLTHNPLFAAGNVMSDMPCAVLTLWAIMMLERMWHRPEGGPTHWAGWAAGGLLAGFALLFRYSSASLFVAIVVVMASRKMWKPMVATFAGSAVVLAPWFIFRAMIGGESYAREYSERFPTLGKLLYSFGHSAGSMIAEALPTMLLPLNDTRSVATLLVGALISTLVLFGAVRWYRAPEGRETPLAPAYVLATLLMALVWQMSYLYLQIELVGRLLVAAIPLLYLCLARGVREISALTPAKSLPWRPIATVVVVLLALFRTVPWAISGALHGVTPKPAPPATLQMLDHIRQVVKPDEIVYAWNGPMVSLYSDRHTIAMLVMYDISAFDFVQLLLKERPAYVLGWPNFDANGKDLTVGLLNAVQKEIPNVLLTEWVSPDPRLVLFRVDYAELDRLVKAAHQKPKTP